MRCVQASGLLVALETYPCRLFSRWLAYNRDAGLFVYACDYAPTAVHVVQVCRNFALDNKGRCGKYGCGPTLAGAFLSNER